MSAQQKNGLISLGFIKSAYGIKGWVKVKSYTSPEANILNYSEWIIKKKDLQSIATIESSKKHGKSIIVKLLGCDDRDQALLHAGFEIFVESDSLPELDDEYIYWYQLEGLAVYYQQVSPSSLLGVISHMLDMPANHVAVVKPSTNSIDKKERLIPWVINNTILNVDTTNGLVIVDWDPDF